MFVSSPISSVYRVSYLVLSFEHEHSGIFCILDVEGAKVCELAKYLCIVSKKRMKCFTLPQDLIGLLFFL